EIEVIQEELDDTCERERNLKDVCEKLRIEIEHLSRNLQESYAKEAESERQLQSVAEQCERVMGEKEKLAQELTEGKRELEQMMHEKAHMDSFHNQTEAQIAQHKEKIHELRVLCGTEQHKREEMQRQLDDRLEEVDQKRRQLENLKSLFF
ncbi:MAG: hypothetical protein MHMPM18_004996, partial [Marteilia pararefringens]